MLVKFDLALKRQGTMKCIITHLSMILMLFMSFTEENEQTCQSSFSFLRYERFRKLMSKINISFHDCKQH